MNLQVLSGEPAKNLFLGSVPEEDPPRSVYLFEDLNPTLKLKQSKIKPFNMKNLPT